MPILTNHIEALPESIFSEGRFFAQRRKGAKRCRVSKGFLCAFAGEIFSVELLFVQSAFVAQSESIFSGVVLRGFRKVMANEYAPCRSRLPLDQTYE
jgi:hypothetical protein